MNEAIRRACLSSFPRFSLLFLLCACWTLDPHSALGQVGGGSVYDFLHLSPTARITGLGGVLVSQQQADPGLAFQNPAALSDSTHSHAQVSYANFLKEVGSGTFAYAHSEPKLAHFWGGVQYFSYGRFDETDILGNKLGDFTVSMLSATAGAARDFGPLTLGMNLKYVQSSIYRQTSWGIATDFGAQYSHEKWGLSAGLVFRNLGLVLNRLPGQSDSEGIPFSVDIGISQKLPKAPLRFNITATQLNRPKMIYQDPTAPVRYDLAGNVIDEAPGTGEQLMRHMIFGMELLPTPGFSVRFAYNHRRRQELHPPDLGFNFDGLSLGVGLRISSIYLDYAYAGHHVAGGMHHIQLTLPMQRIVKKSLIRRNVEKQPIDAPIGVGT